MLGLDTKDSRILSAISQKTRSNRALAQHLKLSERGLAYRLHRLQRLHLIEARKGFGNEKLWSIRKSSNRGVQTVDILTKDNFGDLSTLALTIPKRSIIYILEGLGYSQRAARLRKDAALAKKVQRHYRTGKILMRVIQHPETVKQYQALSSEAMREMHGRLTAIQAHFRAELLRGPCGYLCTKKWFAMINHKDKIAIVVRDRHLVRFIYEVMQMLYDALDYAGLAQATNSNKIFEYILSQRSKHALDT